MGLLHCTSKLHEFQWGFYCCCHYVVTLKLLKFSFQKLRINWADRMTLCAPGKWIVRFCTVECSVLQAKLFEDISVLIFIPINCMYLEEINYCNSYLLLPIKSYLSWSLPSSIPKTSKCYRRKNILTKLWLLIQPPFVICPVLTKDQTQNCESTHPSWMLKTSKWILPDMSESELSSMCKALL